MDELIELLQSLSVRVRVKWCGDSTPSRWDKSVFSPVAGYLETGFLGPVQFADIEWIEIDALERQQLGRLIPEKVIDHSQAISDSLQELELPFVVRAEIFRVKLD